MHHQIMDQLANLGQSVWLDYISRALITSGKLSELISSGLRGMTSNPTIFDHAVKSGNDYDVQLKTLHAQGKSTFELYDEVTRQDIRDAADAFMPVYERTGGLDGFVSLEINPILAYNTTETIEEGRRLAAAVDRPNVMFKVPATTEGYPAIATLLGEGININITLIFSLEQYRKTAEAYVKGMKDLVNSGGGPARVRSVASIFVSRIDTAVDRLLDARLSDGRVDVNTKELSSLKGKAAVANSQLIYREFRDFFARPQFKELEKQGVALQRVLWGSTGTKNPAYSDIKYVAELIGKHTVNTVPEHTLAAFIDHGEVQETITADAWQGEQIIAGLNDAGIDLNDVCTQLLRDGVVAFENSFQSLLETIQQKTAGL